VSGRDQFYAERDRRTAEYGVVGDVFERPVSLVVGKRAAGAPNVQLATLALVNMLARLHRAIELDVPPVPLHRQALVAATRLDEAAVNIALQVDPFIRIGSVRSGSPSIGLGDDAPRGLPFYIGAVGQIGLIDRQPLPHGDGTSPNLGACLASCLGASNLLGQVLNSEVRPAKLSLWNFREGEQAAHGPTALGRLDVGDVVMVGAGGVGSCFAYWLREFGVAGRWTVVDGDFAELHNTNRSLGLFPKDAGWPDGQPVRKASAAAALIGAQSADVWYDQFDQDSFKPDLVLPLANDRGVRNQIAARGEPVLIHATTSRLWEAQLHRHIAGRDDCIACRMPQPAAEPAFSCSTGPVPVKSGQSTDAALPFLSAAAGLLLLAGLFRLHVGELGIGEHNFWALKFRDAHGWLRRSVWACHEGCGMMLPASVRRSIHARRRWSHLDPGESA
jgi:hypothetical protein